MTRLLLFAAVLLAPAAAAQTALEATLIQMPATAPQTTAHASGATLVRGATTGMVLAEGAPFHLSTSDCSYQLALGADGMPQSDAAIVCQFIDGDGDVFVSRSLQSAANPDQLTWVVLPGSGKYAEATGSGTGTRMARTADARDVWRVTGTITYAAD